MTTSMRGRRRVFLAVLLSGSAAFAQVGDARVTAILRRGVELRQQGRDEAALQEFRRAYQLSPEPRVIAQVAVAEQAVGHWVAASNHIGQALAASADPWIQRNRATLEQARQEIERHVGRLLVTGGVTGAEVFVDGERVATLPMTAVTVLAGSGVMEVRAQGFAPVSRTVRVAAGETARERVVLAPVQRAAEAAPQHEGPVVEARFTPVGETGPVQTISDALAVANFERLVLDVGLGMGMAFLTGRPSYAEQRLLVNSEGQVVARNCGDVVCYQTIDPGFGPTFYIHVGARYQISRRIGVGVAVRLQFDAAPWEIPATAGGSARSNPFANLLISPRLYVAFARSASNSFRAFALGGLGVGQIEPRPVLPSTETRSGAHILSGYGNVHAGVRLEWAPVRHFHVGLEVVAQLMFTTILFDIDTTVVSGVHF